MRRGKNSTFGQRGGDGPNTGKKAVTFGFVRPDGVAGKTRVFKNVPDCEDAFVVLYPPFNSHGWITGRVSRAESDFDGLMAAAARDIERYPTYSGPMPVIVPCKRISKV